MNIQFPDLLRPFLGKLLWRKNSSEKVIYVTFDDGPVPEVTPRVLDMLDEYNLKATFFCVGENVEKYPELYNDILRRGHKTGNHTYNHLKGVSVSTEDYVANVQKASEIIDSRLFRPPYGRINYKQKKALRKDYEIVMWDVITQDYNTNLTPKNILQNIKRYSRNGSLVVFHDSIKAERNMLTVLPRAIEYWNSKGYRFEVL
ncbi:MAG: polysaccharide deacetylase family protein [Paludibacter sp.]|nr:polysaccharide deacetylase family protein [Paludibacter sp.]